MKIRTQLLLSAAIALGIALGAGAAAYLAAAKAAQAEAQQERAQLTARALAELLVSTYEYGRGFQAAEAAAWRDRYAEAAAQLGDEQASATTGLQGLRELGQQLRLLFDTLAHMAEQPGEIAGRRRDFLLEELLVDTRMMADEAYVWARESARIQQAQQQQYQRIASAGLAALAVLILVEVIFIWMRVFRPLIAMRRATEAIGKGDFSQKINSPSTDEFGMLSNRFDAMTDALETRTQALHREMNARQRSEQQMRTIADNLPVLISYVDRHERVRFANATFRRQACLDPAAAVGQPLSEVIGPVHYQQWQAPLQQGLSGQVCVFEEEVTTSDGTHFLQNTFLPDTQPDGSIAGIYVLGTDVTSMKRAEKRLEWLTRTDSLTSIANRREFEERLPQAMARARRSARSLALLFLDIDKFKSINDTLGHGMGDEVLKEFARRLLHCVRETDTAARLAGDEFVIILEGLQHRGEPEAVAQKIIGAITLPFVLGGQMLSVSTSIGISFYEGGAEDPAALVERADQALYDAKAAGRGTFRTDSSGMAGLAA